MLSFFCGLLGICAAAGAVAPPSAPAVLLLAAAEAKPDVEAVAPPVPTMPLLLPLAQPSAATGLDAWRRYAVTAAPPEGRPTITLMIDDMGLARVQSARAVALPAPMTLSWMPYAEDLSAQVANGAAHGHETMVHMPMEALGHMNPGPNTLRTWLSPETNLAYLRAALDSIPGAVGLNQHEGSVASLSVPLMDLVAGELHERGMLFVDSLTIPHSVALRRALADGVPAIPRDVFLDNSPDPAAIRAQLLATEAVARRYGHATAIGHPRTATMDALEQYVPTMAARGFVLWPVSATVAAQNRIQLSGHDAPTAP